MKALIVDDVALTRRLLESAIRDLGDIIMAEDGQSAIRAIDSARHDGHPIDLICLDINLPDMSGIDVLQHLRDLEAREDIPEAQRSRVLVISSVSDINVVKKAMQLGCDGYIRKPHSLEKVRKEIRRLKLT